MTKPSPKNFLLVHAEVGAAVGDEFVGLFEGAFVEQELDALAGEHLALLVLVGVALLASAGFGEGVAALEFGEFLLEVHAGDYKVRGGGGNVTGDPVVSGQSPVASKGQSRKRGGRAGSS